MNIYRNERGRMRVYRAFRGVEIWLTFLLECLVCEAVQLSAVLYGWIDNLFAGLVGLL